MPNLPLILAVFIAGLSGIIAQVILLRELLINFFGNELTLGVILANWLIAEAAGVFIIGKSADAVRNKINIFIALQIFFSLFLPIAVYSSRVFKHAAGILPGETIGLPLIFLSSFLIIFPSAFSHGGLFSCGCKLISAGNKTAIRAVGNIYTVETLGSIAGGIISSYLLFPFLNSFQSVFLISITNFFVCAMLLKHTKSRILKYITISFTAIFIYLYASPGIDYLHRSSVSEQFKPNQVLDYGNSIYGNLAVTKKEGQNTFFYNGVPVITAPFPDITFVEEFGHLPLLFHANPGKVLILGGGVGGLISEILEHPIKKLDYVELDPLIIDKVKEFPTMLTEGELSDKRVNIFHMDNRFFIGHTFDKYDITLIGVSAPWDLSTNRFFTAEFFHLMKARLTPGGIMAFYLPGSMSYIGRELRDLNACVLTALKANYAYTRVIPGDYNIFLASDSSGLPDVNSFLITERIKELGVKTNVLVPAHLDYRLDKKKSGWFEQSLTGATSKMNSDDVPYAVFQMLVFWNKQFSVLISDILTNLSRLNLAAVISGIIGITLILFFIFKLSRRANKLIIAYSIATTGFFSMSMSLVLLFSFQVLYGYIFQMAGLLISVFMAGSSLGSLFISRLRGKSGNERRLFIKLEILIILFTCFSAVIIANLPAQTMYLYPIFLILFFISGVFTGLEFPLSAKMYSDKPEQIGVTSGVLYFADLMGGCAAGIFGGIFFLPVLGLFNTCVVIIFFKLSSLILFLCQNDLCVEEIT